MWCVVPHFSRVIPALASQMCKNNGDFSIVTRAYLADIGGYDSWVDITMTGGLTLKT
jgi:hypothetical protein